MGASTRRDSTCTLQEWSEEDEIVLNNLIYGLANDRIGNNRDEYVDWLKSLKPQPHWKPTDEQMNLLREVQEALMGKDCHNRFVNFMYELKKL